MKPSNSPAEQPNKPVEQTSKNVNDMSLVELKALSYDMLAQREALSMQLNEIAKLIQQKLNEKK